MYCPNYQIGDLAGPRSPNWRSGRRQVAKLAVLVVQNFWVNFLQFYKVWKVFWHQCRMLYIVSINVVFFVVCCLLCFVVFLDSLVYMVWTKNTKMSFFALFICTCQYPFTITVSLYEDIWLPGYVCKVLWNYCVIHSI